MYCRPRGGGYCLGGRRRPGAGVQPVQGAPSGVHLHGRRRDFLLLPQALDLPLGHHRRRAGVPGLQVVQEGGRQGERGHAHAWEGTRAGKAGVGRAQRRAGKACSATQRSALQGSALCGARRRAPAAQRERASQTRQRCARPGTPPASSRLRPGAGRARRGGGRRAAGVQQAGRRRADCGLVAHPGADLGLCGQHRLRIQQAAALVGGLLPHRLGHLRRRAGALLPAAAAAAMPAAAAAVPPAAAAAAGPARRA